MKCTKCQSEMIQAKNSWLCMNCGHLESDGSAPAPVKDAAAEVQLHSKPADEPKEPESTPAVESVTETKPDTTPTPGPEEPAAKSEALATSEISHRIALSANELHPAPAKPVPAPVTDLKPAEAPIEAPAPTPDPAHEEAPKVTAPEETPKPDQKPEVEAKPADSTSAPKLVAQDLPTPAAAAPDLKVVTPVTHPRKGGGSILVVKIILGVLIVVLGAAAVAYFMNIDPVAFVVSLVKK